MYVQKVHDNSKSVQVVSPFKYLCTRWSLNEIILEREISFDLFVHRCFTTQLLSNVFHHVSRLLCELGEFLISFDINVRSTPINNEIAITWIIPPTDTFLVDHTEETKTENQKPQYSTSKTSHIRIYVHIGIWDINPSDYNHKHERFVRVVPILKELILSLHDIEQYRTIPNDN